jgi:multidrug resistance efflux pump
MKNHLRHGLVIAGVFCLIVIALIVGSQRPKRASGAAMQAPSDVLVAQVSGYLLERDYQEGATVRTGQLLFEIDSRPFQAALDQAEGQLAHGRVYGWPQLP